MHEPTHALPPVQAVIAKRTADVTIHTLIAPPSSFSVTSQVIEFKTQLFVIDGQLFAPFAAEVKAYADRLGKPVTRFYISHEHPDHYLGMGDAWAGVDIHALPEVRRHIEQDGPRQLASWNARLGPRMVAQTLAPPTHDVTPGEETIDGVTLQFAAIEDGESPAALAIKLPEQGVYIAQDLVYHGVHLFISGPTDGWRKALQGMLAEARYTTILAGHGEPADRGVIAQNLAYLDSVDRLRRSALDAEDYQARLLQAYPHLEGAALLNIYLPLLYPRQA